MLNRCPSCQASVLDDDAETCPFCGSPMDPAKAKNFKPAAAPAPTKKSSAASKPSAATATPDAPKSSSTKPARAPAKPVSPENDDPFATDAAAAAGATPLSRKPTPQRPHKIVCPMCDTPGFAPTTASGKEVRCANPNCLVPVFTAPDFAAPKPVEPEPQSSGSGATIATFAVVAVLLLGAAGWWFFIREPPLEVPSGSTVTENVPLPSVPNSVPTETAPVSPAEVKPAPPSPQETLALVAKRWPSITEDITQPQRQNLLRRYGAEAYAIAGNVDAAREQISKIQSGRSNNPLYVISPLAELSWAHLAAGDEAAARATFEESVPLTSQITPQGFDPARVVVDWATAAARFGQEQAARDLASVPRDDASGEQLLATLYASSVLSRGNLDVEYGQRPVLPLIQAKSVAVALSLLDRGAAEQAKSWAAGASDAIVRAELLAAVAEATASDAARTAEDRTKAIEEAVASSTPAERAFVLSRAAIRLAAGGQKAAAEGLLAKAVEIVSQFPPAEPFLVTSVAEFYQKPLPEPADAWLPAAALCESAHASSLVGQTPQAETLMMQALERLRASAPSVPAMTERQQEFDRLGISGVQSELKNSLSLPNDDRARQAANEYRRKLQQLHEAAALRFQRQVDLLSRGITWKLGPRVLSEAKTRNEATDVGAKEGYFSGSAGGRLLASAELARDAATAKALRDAGVTNRNVPVTEALALTIRPMLDESKFEAAGRELDGSRWNRVGRSDKLSLAIRTACRITVEKSPKEALTFAAAIPDELVREETLRYLSICGAFAGQAAEFEALLSGLRLLPSDQAAVLRGLTEGLVDVAKTGAAPTNQTQQAESTGAARGAG